VKRALLDYELPQELIASRPANERDGARLLVLDGGECASHDGAASGPIPRDPKGPWVHAAVRDLAELLAPGSLLVLNDTRVIPARLLGRKESGGRVEIFLVRRLGAQTVEEGGRVFPAERWQALGRASKPLRPGARITLARARAAPAVPAALSVRIEGRVDEGGLLEVVLFSPSDTPIATALEAFGHVPLPPYLRRTDEETDRERYQTVFARVPGAVAAPTAGLHLSSALLDRIRARGIDVSTLTLHVGLGTFQPVMVADLDDHPMHAERFEIPFETAAAIDRARARRAPVIAVGTTVVRALESAALPAGRVRAGAGETRLLIQPGYSFRVVDQLLTNFHLPQSTLLALVAAFAGRARTLAAYRAAIEARYRFFSYGDAMLIRSRATVEPSEAER
jgi:S-adenosylmethionine:tRNA ribosyltransferase-isomerase